MDTVSFFLIGHGRLHFAEVAGETSYADRVFAGLTDDEMRARPGKGLNSLVWLLWHMARTEDVAVNVVVAGRPQVLDDHWLHRLNVPWRTIGTGMTDDEVSELSAQADVAAIRAYRSAVGLRTREVVTTLRPEAWDEILGIADTVPANAAGAFARGWVDGLGYRAWQGIPGRLSSPILPSGTTRYTLAKPSRSGVRLALVLASSEQRGRFDGRRTTACSRRPSAAAVPSVRRTT